VSEGQDSNISVAPQGKCRVWVLELKTTIVVTSDCWLLKVGVKLK